MAKGVKFAPNLEPIAVCLGCQRKELDWAAKFFEPAWQALEGQPAAPPEHVGKQQ
jgi:hypothetical protein